MPAPLLSVQDLTTVFRIRGGSVTAVDRVSFDIHVGQIVGLVGESGSGKSATALSIAGLIERPGFILSGRILLDGKDLVGLPESELTHVRGRQIGYVFQDSMSSLNPTMRIGDHLVEVVRHHLGLRRRDAYNRAVAALMEVGIPRASERMSSYPHEFSGGMRQRTMLAMAMVIKPKLLIADEPTTALDVTIQAQILDLIKDLAQKHGTAVLLITHDLAVASQICDFIHVMYAGQIVESAPSQLLFDRPESPYTEGLLRCLPDIADDPDERFRAIEGTPVDMASPPAGCRFAPRCEYAREICVQSAPRLSPRSPAERMARCWASEKGGWRVA